MIAKNVDEWAKIVMYNANYQCEWCGSTINLKAHHNINKDAYRVNEALNPDYGMCLCERCHKEYHKWNKRKSKNRINSKIWRKK